MSQQPFNSDGGFSSTANVVAGNIRVVQSIVPANNASPAPSLNGFSSVSAANLSASGNVTGNYILGNVAFATGIPATYGNANVATFLDAFGSNTISTTGNISSGDLSVNGTVTVTGGGAIQIGDSTLTADSVLGGTATISPGSVTSTKTMSATGNITGGNLSATGNVYDSRGQIFNVPASYAKYTRTTQQTGSLVANTVIVCNVSENTFGSDISVNTGTGQVTLQAGRTYRLRGSVPGWTGSGGVLQWCWYNETTPGWLGASGENYPPSSNASYGAAGGSAEAVFTPGATTVVSFRILSAGSVTALGGNSDFNTTASYPWIDVQVIGGQAALTGFSTTGNITGGNIFGNGSTLSNVATQVTRSWTVPTGNSTQSFTVNSGTYSMWVDCNITNGILVWNATATVTNTNVPVVGAQYAWVYNGGGTPIDFTSIPNQFTGTANAIVRSNTAPSSTTNRFDFGINNTSGNAVTVRYGWVQIS
jgi:hypothetical protein